MIDCLNHCQLAANIELKPVVGEEHILAKAVATCIEQHWPATLTPPIFSSFHHKSLVYLRQYLPACHVALLFHRWHRACIALLKEHNAIALHANYRSLTPQRVALVKQQGFYVAAYTVNKVALMNKLFARGVDAVFSDYPNLQGE
jgi:glycerophosphoryl diester phosphodiesterase